MIETGPAFETQKERRDSLERLVVPFERPLLASEICVRQWRVAVVTCWLELSLLRGLLGCLLLAALFRCLFLSTFFSCHS
jgi:hypothetical protein